MSSSTPTKKPNKGIPVGRMLGILSVFGFLGLAALGAWSLFGMVKFTNFPITGEWQAQRKPWHIEFRADKTIVSSTGPSQSGASQTWTSEPGKYKIDYFGNLWVMLKSGKTYTAALVPPAESLAPASHDRFDLIDSATDSVTVFERVLPANPKTPDAPEQPAGAHP
ncbi:MAG TPA: hypothetical protein VMU78_04540 [Methylocella sp.]|nr:hypothetical protein [Methylocella sp.]